MGYGRVEWRREGKQKGGMERVGTPKGWFTPHVRNPAKFPEVNPHNNYDELYTRTQTSDRKTFYLHPVKISGDHIKTHFDVLDNISRTLTAT